MKVLQFVIFAALSACALGRIQPRVGSTEIQGETYLPSPENMDLFEQLSSERASSPTCNGASVDLSGTTINSPVVLNSQNYPNNYVNDITCNYNFIVPANMEAIIRVDAFNVECPYDDVQIIYSSNLPSVSMCPTATSSYVLGARTSSYPMYIRFSTDNSVTYSGFSFKIYLRPIGSCTCGRFTTTRHKEQEDIDRIVGGFTARPHAYPYQVGLMRNGGVFCGGTLISPNYVLTAAHCTGLYPLSQIKASVGDHDYTITGDGETMISIDNVLPHPQYNKNTMDYDFAIWHLRTPAQINNYVGIACLALDQAQSYAGFNLTISGWGTIASKGSQPSALKASSVLGMANTECQKTGYGMSINNLKICGYTPNYDTDTCQGDSGGPLVANVNGKVTVVGVTSYGIGCAKKNYPGVYARVTAVKNWILDNSDAGGCQN